MAKIGDTVVLGDARFLGKINILNSMYPVGSIYMSVSSTNPSTLFGGTWEAFGQGRSLLGAGTGTDVDKVSKTFTAGSTGRYYNIATHTHTYAETTSTAANISTSTATGNVDDSTTNMSGGGSTGGTGGNSGGTGNSSSVNGNSGTHWRNIFMTAQGDSKNFINDGRFYTSISSNRRYTTDGSNSNMWARLHFNLSHQHTLNSHTHSIPSHTHTIAAHTHSVAQHTHTKSHSHTIGKHTHTLSGASGHPSASYQTTANNVQPYQSVYMWKRTA